MDTYGTYCTKIYDKEVKAKGNLPLVDGLLKQHLEGKKTIGVFGGKQYCKFILFDIDVPYTDKPDIESARWITYKIINTLIELGIDEKYINVNYSGNKGYHVVVFFNEQINIDLLKTFRSTVLNYGELNNLEHGNVDELKGTDGHGVKLPLGFNYRSKDIINNKCVYVDKWNLSNILDDNYILSIQKMDKEDFYNIINKQKDTGITKNKINKLEKAIGNYKPLFIYKENVDEDATVEKCEKLEVEGLKMQGSRHNSLLLLARYYKHIGLSEESNK